MSLGEAVASRLSGEGRFRSGSEPLNFDVLSYWQWMASDLLANANRGLVAEYLVAHALGADSGIRREWDAYDAETEDGIKVEVKSAAYVQSWSQKRLSTIQFGIARTKIYNQDTNAYDGESARHADVYVFCLLANQEQETLDPVYRHYWVRRWNC